MQSAVRPERRVVSLTIPVPRGTDDTDSLVRGAQAYLKSCLGADAGPPNPPDLRAWEQFYVRYGPAVRRIIAQCRIPAGDRDDCFQEVWTLLICKLHRFVPDARRGRFGAWLERVVRNAAVDYRRRRSAHRPLSTISPRQCDCRVLGAAQDDEREKRRDAVRRALAAVRHHVADTTYAVLVLRWIEGIPPTAIAERLGLTPAEVWTRDCRGRRKLRRLLVRFDR